MRTTSSRLCLNAAAAIAIGATALTACTSTPDGVIPDDEMAELMADIHTAESVVDTERRVFATDSMRRLLKQSVLARYGYTMADFDSSLSYYGRNIDLYAKLYEDVIAILDERIAEAESRSATDIAGGRQGSTSDLDFSVDGDSVDVWALPRTLFFSQASPVSIVPFGLSSDRYWERGDVYTLRGKLSGASDAVAFSVAVEYMDGSVDYLTMRSLGSGWKEATLLTDSAKVARYVYGSISYPQISAKRPPAVLDSISLFRSRFDPRLIRDPRTKSVKTGV